MKGRDSNCYSLQGDDYREGFFSLSLLFLHCDKSIDDRGDEREGKSEYKPPKRHMYGHAFASVAPVSLSLYFSSIHIHIHDALVQHLIIIIISSPSHRPTYDLLTHTYYIIIYSVVIKDLHQDCILYKCFFFLSYIIIAIYMEVNMFNLIRFSFHTKIHT